GGDLIVELLGHFEGDGTHGLRPLVLPNYTNGNTTGCRALACIRRWPTTRIASGGGNGSVALRLRCRAHQIRRADRRGHARQSALAVEQGALAGGALAGDLGEGGAGAVGAGALAGGPAAKDALGGGAHVGGDVEERCVAEDRHRLAVADAVERDDQVQAARGSGGVERRLDLRDGGALVGGEAFGGGWDELVVAAHEDVDLVADIRVGCVVAGGEQRRRQRESYEAATHASSASS